MIHLAGLAVFSGLSLNLLLQFALGTAGVAYDSHSKNESGRQLPFFQLGVLFVSVLFLWVFFTSVFPPHWRSFLEYFLFFPLSALVCMGLEFLREWALPKYGNMDKVFSAFTAYDGLVPVSLLLTYALAGDFASAFVIVLFFVLGNLAAMLALNEIRRRSALEWVPRYLRGSPLVFISMGLLSFISAAVAGICFKILEVF